MQELNKTKIIAITGIARAGKDSLCKILCGLFHSDGISAKRFALADELKNDLAPFILDKFGVDLYNVEGPTKELIRPIMVAYGGAKRKETKGRYWTHKLENKIKEDSAQVAIITDVRYCEYVHDEDFWVKEKMQGDIIHVTRLIDGLKQLPPNEDEASNDPLLWEKADFRLEWGSLDDGGYMPDVLNIYMQLKNKWNL